MQYCGSENKKAPDSSGAFCISYRRELVQRVGNRGEGRLQLGAETLHDGDDGDGDAGGDQAIFNRGCAGFVLHEFLDGSHR